MAGGGYGNTNLGGPFGQSTATGGQMQVPNYMQPYFGNILGGQQQQPQR